jgi:hypothetical protein
MAIFTGFYAIGTAYSPTTITIGELSGGSYARQAVSLVGNFIAGGSQSLGAFGIAASPTILPIKIGAIFDAATGGNQICHWGWPVPYTLNNAAFPATTINISISTGIAAMANVSTAPIAMGSHIGWINGMPLITSRVIVLNAGVFVAQGQPLASTLAVGTMPTTVPAVPGVLWNNAGVLQIS